MDQTDQTYQRQSNVGSPPNGGLFHCDNCLVDITNAPRFKCYTCKFFDLCEKCVLLPLEIKEHNQNHMMDRVDLFVKTKKEVGAKRKRTSN